jgi:hypothetical protein
MQKWQLVPVTLQPICNDPLPSGPYRIRNLNGQYLLTMPDGQSVGETNVYVRAQLDQSPYQRVSLFNKVLVSTSCRVFSGL